MPVPPEPGKPKLLDRIRDFLRVKHYSLRTEDAYLHWIKRFILFHGKRHPDQLGPDAIRAFLTDLAVRGEVAASTQNQALSVLLFLYQQILGRTDLAHLLDGVTPAKRPIKMPIVFTPAEARRVVGQLSGTYRLMGQLLYGSGLRLMECVRLRVKDLDFECARLRVRDGKGQKERVTMLPQVLHEPLQRHLERARWLHEEDLRDGFGAVHLPFALERKSPGQRGSGHGSTCFLLAAAEAGSSWTPASISPSATASPVSGFSPTGSSKLRARLLPSSAAPGESASVRLADWLRRPLFMSRVV